MAVPGPGRQCCAVGPDGSAEGGRGGGRGRGHGGGWARCGGGGFLRLRAGPCRCRAKQRMGAAQCAAGHAESRCTRRCCRSGRLCLVPQTEGEGCGVL